MRNIQRKIVVLGDTGSGKTALVQRFVRGSFTEDYRTTSGAVPSKKTVKHGGITAELVIWDVAGHLLRLHSAFTSDADGAILVCDLTGSPSLEILNSWRDILVKKAGDIPMVVAANKSDLAEVPRCEGLDETKYVIIPTSAKTGKNVDMLFMKLVDMMEKCAQSES